MTSSPPAPFTVVSGGNGGIGLALARRFAAAGHRLLLVARDEARLTEAAADLSSTCGAVVETLSCDLGRSEEMEALARRLDELRPDILVNNAGFGAYGPFEDLPPATAEAMIALNVSALTRLTAAVLPAMRARGSGRILNVASTAAFGPVPLAAVYGATKAYVLRFSEALAEELDGTGITVTALCPGPTTTGFAARAGMGRSQAFAGQLMSADEVAERGFQALMAGRRKEVVGLANKLMVLSARFAPTPLAASVTRWAMRARLS